MKRTKHTALALLLALCVTLGLLPALTPAANAAGAVTYLDATVGADNTVTFTEKTCDSYVAVASGLTTWNAGWYVADGEVTIADRVTVSGEVKLILKDGAKLTASAGITVTDGNSLTIYAQSEGDSMGKLSATGVDGGAGIGGGNNESGGVITVNGGAVTANGGKDSQTNQGAAGIGGGAGGAGGNTTINGGVINATGDYEAAGIGGGGGGGDYGAGGTITVNGGTVTATGGDYGAGIGGGSKGAGGTITVNGGTVTATGGVSGAGIGGGDGGAGGTITINGGTVTANGGTYSAGIGGGYGGASGAISITGGTVNANGNVGGLSEDGGAGIGGGEEGDNSGDGNSISITGGTVTATVPNGTMGAAIGNGGGYGGTDVTVTIGAGATVEAGTDASGTGAAAVTDVANNKNYKYARITFAAAPLDPVPYLDWDETTKTLVEKKGDDACKEYALVTESATAWDSGTDGAWYVVNSDVTISSRITVTGDVHLILCDGKTLTANCGITVQNDNRLTIYAQSGGTGTLKTTGTSGQEEAGIGAYRSSNGSSNCGTVNIKGGVIEAKGGNDAAGIGGAGGNSGGGNITIYGGSVTATGAGMATGIGSGWNPYENNPYGSTSVTIYGGEINATGGERAAGIGGGTSASGITVKIYGGIVNAKGGSQNSAGIGYGDEGRERQIIIAIYGGDVTASGVIAIGSHSTNETIALTVADSLSVKAGDDAASAVTVSASAFVESHTQKYAKITFAASAAPEYTVTAADTTTETDKKYQYGDEFTIAVTVSGADFEGGEFTLKYDSATLEVKTYPANNKFTDGEQTAGTVKFEAQTKTKITDAQALATIAFTVKTKVATETTCNFTFEGTPKICYDTGENSVEAATVTGGSVTVEPITYTVTLTPNPSDFTLTGNNGVASVDNGKAIDGQDYSVTIGNYSATDYEYAVTLAVAGTTGTTTLTPSDAGVITVGKDNITGNLTVTVTRTTKHVTAALEGATGSNDAIKGVDYTATISGYDANNYTYAVTLTMNGASATAPTPDTDGKLTIAGANITGDFTLKVTKTLANFEVNVYENYVTGWTLVAIAKASGRTDEPVYDYDGSATYYVNAYNAYAYLVEGAVTVDEAKTKVSLGASATATMIAAGYDVNNTGKVDYSDALLTYRCYEMVYQTPATAMETYLRADADGSKKVDTTDVSAIDQHRTAET